MTESENKHESGQQWVSPDVGTGEEFVRLALEGLKRNLGLNPEATIDEIDEAIAKNHPEEIKKQSMIVRSNDRPLRRRY